MIERFSPVQALLFALTLTALAVWMTLPHASTQLTRWPGIAAGSGYTATISGVARPQAKPGLAALEQYNSTSQIHDSAADGQISVYQRAIGGGSISYFVVHLGGQAHLEVINANGATPGSDASGDTVWADGGKHLALVSEMVRASYATRDGMELLGAINFGFHGARTSDEGTVVINGQIYRVNQGRAALCISTTGQARIGLFDVEALGDCTQAIGGGPVVLWEGKIANPMVRDATDEFVPFNPLDEDFAEIDWRRKIYSGNYPKTMIGVGNRPDGRSYLVLLISSGLDGIEVARQLQAMGCYAALGGDDDTSTQAVWRGMALQRHPARPVPDALAMYVRR